MSCIDIIYRVERFVKKVFENLDKKKPICAIRRLSDRFADIIPQNDIYDNLWGRSHETGERPG